MAKIIYTLHRRSARPRHLFVAADRAGVHARRGHASSRRATSRSPAASSRRSPIGCTPDQPAAGRPRRARRAGQDARRQHHQAAEHQRVGAAAQGAIKELQQQGYAVPDYPEEPQNDAEKAIKARYAKVLGSAVNPVLREGNSDRRVATSVKQYARKHPHSMGAWSKDSKSHVAHMTGGDFYGSEQSAVVADGRQARASSSPTPPARRRVLKDGVAVEEGDVIAASVMSRRALQRVLREADRRRQGQGRAAVAAPEGDDDEGVRPDHVRPRRRGVLPGRLRRSTRRRSTQLGVDPDNGIGDVYAKIQTLPADQRAAIEADIAGRLRDAAAAGDGRLEQGHHQPARAERRDHRRVDAGGDPRLGPDVGTRRQAARHEGDDPGPLLRRHLPGGHRRLQAARRVRRADDGHRVERRADGAEGRGIRLARQDVRDSRGTARCASSTPTARRSSSTASSRATSGACARRRTCRSATG